eukprot:m.203969 g.203969  ORF g.203969 m.203969 type:complete len:203 (+) comp26014_c0_seq2:200-808(+)
MISSLSHLSLSLISLNPFLHPFSHIRYHSCASSAFVLWRKPCGNRNRLRLCVLQLERVAPVFLSCQTQWDDSDNESDVQLCCTDCICRTKIYRACSSCGRTFFWQTKQEPHSQVRGKQPPNARSHLRGSVATRDSRTLAGMWDSDNRVLIQTCRYMSGKTQSHGQRRGDLACERPKHGLGIHLLDKHQTESLQPLPGARANQ